MPGETPGGDIDELRAEVTRTADRLEALAAGLRQARETSSVRERIVSDENLPRLRELMRFPHFRRDFVEMEYDWVRIDFLLATLDAVHPTVLRHLERFDRFLLALASA